MQSPSGFNIWRSFLHRTLRHRKLKGMVMATLDAIYTCKEAAAELGVSDARVRQLCIEHAEIGRKHNASWLLTEADLLKIKNLPEFGRRTRRPA